MAGDLDRAMQYFDKAATMGLDVAKEETSKVNGIINRDTVEYLIKPSSKN